MTSQHCAAGREAPLCVCKRRGQRSTASVQAPKYPVSLSLTGPHAARTAWQQEARRALQRKLLAPGVIFLARAAGAPAPGR